MGIWSQRDKDTTALKTLWCSYKAYLFNMAGEALQKIVKVTFCNFNLNVL